MSIKKEALVGMEEGIYQEVRTGLWEAVSEDGRFGAKEKAAGAGFHPQLWHLVPYDLGKHFTSPSFSFLLGNKPFSVYLTGLL